MGFGHAQNHYFVYFKDKANNEYSLAKPLDFLSERALVRRNKQKILVSEADLPPSPSYIKALATYGTIRYTSRWFNAALVYTSADKLAKIKSLSFVAGVEGGGDISKGGVQSIYEDSPLAYGSSKTQVDMLGAVDMHTKGFKGQNMLIGILDSGFQNANSVPFLNHLFINKRILKTWDFVDHEANVYNDHNHGLNVLSCIAGNAPNQLIGTAPEASFVLFRTENAATETRIEELNWLFGAEMADSLGVDVVNSSLGYYEFDYDATNYKKSDLNGKTALVTKAARHLARVGVVLCNSAGNEGGSAWQTIIAPADADSIIAVGSVTSVLSKSAFSSTGPTADARIKPDLAAMGSSTVLGVPSGGISRASGTSFSSPLVAGLVAGFWQANPKLTAQEIIAYLKKTASQSTKPDNFLGYGIPNFTKAQQAVELDQLLSQLKAEHTEPVAFENPADINNLNVFIPESFMLPVQWYLQTETGVTLVSGTSTENLFKPDLAAYNPSGLYFFQIKDAKNQIKTIRIVGK